MELRVAVESSNLVEVETVETIPPDHPNIELLESTDGLKAEFVAPGIEVSVVVEKPIALSEVVNSEVVSEFFIAPETKVFAKCLTRSVFQYYQSKYYVELLNFQFGFQ